VLTSCICISVIAMNSGGFKFVKNITDLAAPAQQPKEETKYVSVFKSAIKTKPKTQEIDISKKLDLINANIRLLEQKIDVINLRMNQTKRDNQAPMWIDSNMIPNFVENKIYALAMLRDGTQGSLGNTVIDPNVKLNSVSSFISYFPRAFTIGFFSPFPEHFGGKGSSQAMTVARGILTLIMPVFYLLTLSFLVATYTRRKDPLFIMVAIFCIMGVMLFTYTYANIGTLIRLRYCFYTLALTIGLAQFLSYLDDKFWKQKPKSK